MKDTLSRFLLEFSGSAHKKQTHTESVVIIEGIGI